MGYLSRTAELTVEQATRLLCKKVEGVAVRSIQQIGFTNDVFRVTTASHGNYYVKFFTARWYKDCPDLSGNVEQELAAYHVLRRRGVSLPYEMWGDCSRRVVAEAVLVCSELPGTPLPVVLKKHPEDGPAIWETLGRYLRRIHDIRFTNPVGLGPEHSRSVPLTGVIPHTLNPYVGDVSPRQLAEARQVEALSTLEKAVESGHLAPAAASALRALFGDMAEVIEQELANPHFTVLNVHDHHFHLVRSDSGWEVAGLYDFEHASASDTHVDLVDLEMTVTPNRGSYGWRESFFRGYGKMRCFASFKVNLLFYLVGEIGDPRGRMVPSREWLDREWKTLVDATSLEDLRWFPVGDGAREAAQQQVRL